MSTRSNRKSARKAAGTLGEHFVELRTRFFKVAGVYIVTCIGAYLIHEELLSVVLGPISGQKLVYLTPGGGFNFIFSIILYAGLVAVAPFVVYQLYQFLKPALPDRVKRHTIKIFMTALVLMSAGVSFGYFVGIPAALTFLLNFATDYINPNLTADSYLNFFMAYVAGLGILFQLPLLLLFWNWVSPLPKGGLLNSQRYVIAGAFIMAALITPTPDALNQVMIAGPIVVIYQFGVVAVFFMNRKARRAAAKASIKAAKKAVTETPAVAIPTPIPTLVPRQVFASDVRRVKPAHSTYLAAPLPVATQKVVAIKKPAAAPQPLRPATRLSMDMRQPSRAHAFRPTQQLQATRSTSAPNLQQHRSLSPSSTLTRTREGRSIDGFNQQRHRRVVIDI